MVVDNFVESRNGIGISCMRFSRNCHSFVISQNILFFTENNITHRVIFKTFSKVSMIVHNTDLSKIIKEKNGKYYKYSSRKYSLATPEESLKDFIHHNFLENNNDTMTQEKMFYVMYD